MKNYFLFLFFILIFPYACFALSHEKEYTLGEDSWHIYKMNNLQKTNFGKMDILTIKRLSIKNDFDLFLPFENNIKNENYLLLHGDKNLSFLFKKEGNTTVGNFSHYSYELEYLPKPSSILYPGKEIRELSFGTWIYPYYQQSKQIIFQYQGLDLSKNEIELTNKEEDKRKKYGFTIYIQDHFIYFTFSNFFWDHNGKSHSITLRTQDPLVYKKWQQIAFTYSPKEHKLTTYLDGLEQEMAWTTIDGSQTGEVLYPSMQKEIKPLVSIGKDSIFLLKNLFLSSHKLPENYFSKSFYPTKDIFFTTDVFSFTDSYFFLKQVSLLSNLEGKVHYQLFYRIYNQTFSPDLANDYLPWIEIANKATKFPEAFKGGNFIQFKVVLHPEETQDLSNLALSGIKISYLNTVSPYIPHFFNITEGDTFVELSWPENYNANIIGFEIYYGTKSEFYINEEANEGVSPIYIPSKELGGPLFSYKITGLENNKPYYISIRSIDAFGNKSDFSKEIRIVPSPVKNGASFAL